MNCAIMTAAFALVAVGLTALAVDIGKVYVDSRKAQSVTDLAAIVAAANLSNATNAASATVQKNQFPVSALTLVQPGVHTANAAVAPSARFVAPPAASANAVMVSLRTQSPLVFGKLFYPSGSFTIVTRATAATTAVASFSIGSSLVTVNGGLINALLGGLLGTNLTLSAVDYQSLISTQIDAFSFLNALATQVNFTGPTYNQLLQSNLKVSDVLRAMLTTRTSGGNSATTALAKIVSAVSGSTTTIVPQSLISLGPYSGLPVGQAPKFSLSMSVLDLLAATAQVANGTNQIATGVNLGLPGIATATLTVSVGQMPQGTSWVAAGAQGATVQTAQVRVQLNVNLLGSGSIASVNLPIFIQVASATATLSSVACNYSDVTQSTATLAVTPGIVNAWIGQVSTANISNWATSPNPSPATLLSRGPEQITGSAYATMSNTVPTSVTFTYPQIQADTMQTVTTTNYPSSLTTSLLDNLSISVFGLTLPGLDSGVVSLIASATSSVDQLLATVLSTLGISLGQANVWVSGIRCDGAVLVN